MRNVAQLNACGSHEELLATLWPLLTANIHHSAFEGCRPATVLQDIALEWIQGTPFSGLLNRMNDNKVRIGTERHPRYPTVEHVVDICENALSFEGMLSVGAVSEIIGSAANGDSDNLVRNLQELQKRLKYGLPMTSAIALYELGFADRVVSMELSLAIDVAPAASHQVVAEQIRRDEQRVRAVLVRYPRYFTHVLDELL